jgi:hypothetical protein
MCHWLHRAALLDLLPWTGVVSDLVSERIGAHVCRRAAHWGHIAISEQSIAISAFGSHGCVVYARDRIVDLGCAM